MNRLLYVQGINEIDICMDCESPPATSDARNIAY